MSVNVCIIQNFYAPLKNSWPETGMKCCILQYADFKINKMVSLKAKMI
jgi:hypothetical protein